MFGHASVAERLSHAGDPARKSRISLMLTAVFELSQQAARVMERQGGGKIINIASLASFQGGWTVPTYRAAKHGVAGLTKALANEWAAKNIHVNAIAPGYFDTEMCAAIVNDAVFELLHVGITQNVFKHGFRCVIGDEFLADGLGNFAGGIGFGTSVITNKQQRITGQQGGQQEVLVRLAPAVNTKVFQNHDDSSPSC